jgi:hypothetical protein
MLPIIRLTIVMIAAANVLACKDTAVTRPAPPELPRPAKQESPTPPPVKVGPSVQMETAVYPGGKVHRQNGIVISTGCGRAKSTAPRDILMAKRAAYLVAVRNAGLFLSGIRFGRDGKLSDGSGGRLAAQMIVRDFKEISSSFDPKTRTATATVELKLP